jgi:hypothetical protein
VSRTLGDGGVDDPGVAGVDMVQAAHEAGRVDPDPQPSRQRTSH